MRFVELSKHLLEQVVELRVALDRLEPWQVPFANEVPVYPAKMRVEMLFFYRGPYFIKGLAAQLCRALALAGTSGNAPRSALRHSPGVGGRYGSRGSGERQQGNAASCPQHI